ncbi:MAG: energy transducer TonB [Prevotellaceae bacterium]|jgi:protein TonB|nr:energy transducer TonB [Prevotellaceae bacterium]
MLFTKKEIRFMSPEWCDYVFANKNKSYGAYQIRTTSSKRHILAFLITIAAVVTAFAVPAAIEQVKAANPQWQQETGVITLTSFNNEPETPDKPLEVPVNVPPPPKVIGTLAFVVPKMVDASDINPENPFLSQDKLHDTDIAIGTRNIDGDIGGYQHPDEVKKIEVFIEKAPEPEKIEIVPERRPEFPGGDKEMYSLINDNLRYPQIAIDNRIQGTATIRFVVEKDGSVSDVTLLRGFNEPCNKEAMRVIKLMGMQKWVPGRNGKGDAVRAYFTIPVKFKLKD